MLMKEHAGISVKDLLLYTAGMEEHVRTRVTEIYTFLILIYAFLIVGCPASKDICSKAFTVNFEGAVVDASNNPIQDVEVYFVSHGNVQSLIAKTDVNGSYKFTWYRHATIGTAKLIFVKSGFQDASSDEKVVGSSCQDEDVITDMVLVP